MDSSMKSLAAEFVGTFWLVLGGCGSAVLAATFMAEENLNIGLVGVSLAFGLTVVTGAYSVGHISGGHFNPAVTIGLVVGNKFSPAKVPGYIISQVLGGIGAAAVLYGILTASDMEIATFAANGYGEFSPGGFTLASALITEIVLTAIFLIVILGATAKNAATGMGGLAIGLALTLIHLISIPVTNTSVNPARSTSQAIFAGGDHIAQLWLFWVAPIVGAAIGALIHRYLLDTDNDVVAT